MPDADKKKPDQDKPEDKDVQRDSLGNEIEAGPPPVEGEEPKEQDPAQTDAKDETEIEIEPEPEPKPKEAKEHKKEVPPDLVPPPEESVDESEEADEKPQEESESEPESKPEPALETKAPETDDENTPFDDEKTEQAIDDIVAKEGDDLLAVQDAAGAKGKVDVPRQRSGFWRKKWVRSILLLLVFGGIAAALALPTSRYWALNTAGVRSSSSLKVVDSTTQLPLKGVEVTVGNKQALTDSEGNATLSDLKLGAAQLTIGQVGFEEIHRDIVVGWGSNPLGNFALKATGVQYVIEVTDYLSEQPLEGVEATNGGVTAVSDKEGKITLTLESTLVAKDGVVLSKAGYRSKPIDLNDDPKEPTQAAMVVDRKAVFVSKQSGKYDVYKSDVDGENREVLLAGTGHENSNISLVVSQDGKRAAYVSTRDNKRDDGGFLLSSLVLINVENGSALTIAEAAQIQLIDWVGSRLVFQLGSSDSDDEERYTVSSYDYTSNTRVQLAAAKKLQAVMSAKGLIYYAPAADSSDPSLELGLFKIAPDGKDKQRVVDTELSSVLRAAYGTLQLQAADGTWLSYDLASGAKTQVGTPSSLASRLYTDNEGRTKSLWVDQGTIKVYDVATTKDTDVATVSGITYPLRWAGASTVIFRVSNASETADYVVDPSGGTPHKITDVTPTYGFSQAQ